MRKQNDNQSNTGDWRWAAFAAVVAGSLALVEWVTSTVALAALSTVGAAVLAVVAFMLGRASRTGRPD